MTRTAQNAVDGDEDAELARWLTLEGDSIENQSDDSGRGSGEHGVGDDLAEGSAFSFVDDRQETSAVEGEEADGEKEPAQRRQRHRMTLDLAAFRNGGLVQVEEARAESADTRAEKHGAG